ncbi:MAG: HD domain-containing phosphohydrolase [Vicinamibacterales bacterium]
MAVPAVSTAPIAAGPSVPVMDVIAGLSRALDITEGHPRGHAVRSCLIGMRLGRRLGLDETAQSDLFHALLLKDAGCSSNAARVHQLFGGDDHPAKRAVWLTDWRRWPEKIRYGLEYAGKGEPWPRRLARIAALAAAGPRAERELFAIRCDRGAAIALDIGLSPAAAAAIRWMDEHWDGGGQPDGLRGDRIPLPAQVIGIAQVLEIFWQEGGVDAARQVARARRRRWFSPDLADHAAALCGDADFWRRLGAVDSLALLHETAPAPALVVADAARLDRVVEAFAGVIDAKSPYTHDHSRRVADYAVAAAARLGFAPERLVRLRRAALLHDIGKLGVSNAVLDKPGSLTAAEWEAMRAHTRFTLEILEAVPVFAELAHDAAAHHERLDGRGYDRGLPGAALSPSARVLAVADVTDALLSDRPYRAGLPADRVIGMLEKDASAGALCAQSVAAMVDVLRA